MRIGYSDVPMLPLPNRLSDSREANKIGVPVSERLVQHLTHPFLHVVKPYAPHQVRNTPTSPHCFLFCAYTKFAPAHTSQVSIKSTFHKTPSKHKNKNNKEKENSPTTPNPFSLAHSLNPALSPSKPQCCLSFGVLKFKRSVVPFVGARATNTYLCLPVLGGGPGAL